MHQKIIKQAMKNRSCDEREGKSLIKPTNHVPITNWCKKYNKSTKTGKNIDNRYDGLTADIQFENVEYEEESVQQKIGEKKQYEKRTWEGTVKKQSFRGRKWNIRSNNKEQSRR